MRLSLLRIALWLLLLPSAGAEVGPYFISGTVVDPSGAGIPGAAIRARGTGTNGISVDSQTDQAGAFRISGLPRGVFDVEVQRNGFGSKTTRVTIKDRAPAPLRIQLKLAEMRQELTVTEAANQVTTDAGDNLDAAQIDRQMMDNLPVFDQNYVATMSQFLDAGAVGTNGVTLVVNGMEQRNIGVSASAIQQVKINNNPYSAEFSRPGRGRIEVILKPDSPVYHGTFNFLFRDYHLNARDPFAVTRPQEQRRIYEGSLLGPVGHNKRNSFLISINREEQNLQAIVYANTGAGVLQATAPNPQRNTEIAASVTHQFTERHLTTARVNFYSSSEQNRGVGGLVLPEAGVNTTNHEKELYFNDSLTITPNLLNQFRVVFGRQQSPTTSITSAPAIVVPGAFTGGGAQADRLQTENHMNLNEIVSWNPGKHNIRTGINVPDISRRGLTDRTNVLGTYSFASLADYAADRPYSFIEQQGNGHIVFLEVVAGAFIQDDYRLRPNLTLSAGLRYDWQNFFHDNNNFSPRLALAYSPGQSRKTVLRVGGGIFYDRTGNAPIFDLEKYNGVRLQQIVLTDPAYPLAIAPQALLGSPATIVRLDPTVRIPYLAQFSAAFERQLSAGNTLSFTYWASRGVSLFRSRDVNAPPPPDYSARPNPSFGVYRQIESSGHLESNAFEISYRGKITRFFQAMAQYTLSRTLNDVPGNYSVSARGTGISSFPANNYDLSGEWARADYDALHRLNLMGSVHAGKYVDVGVALFVNSGMPYTETTGRDDYHTGYANARPPGVPRNSLQGPGFVETDVRWSHTFALKQQKDSPRFVAGLDAFNVVNRVNYSGYVGDLSSPFFGRAVSATPARRLQASLRFEF